MDKGMNKSTDKVKAAYGQEKAGVLQEKIANAGGKS